MIPEYDEQGVTIYWSHSIFVLLSMPDNSVDSIVTDPPYGLKFMGKKWDYDVPSVQLWREALRILKPGGYLLSFAGSRTYHRMAVNIEDAGFEIRDQIMWIYGSGFPKSLDVSKAIDKAAGVEREKIRHKARPETSETMSGKSDSRPWIEESREKGFHEVAGYIPITSEAQQWDGWGTALKPAHEPIVVARKPIMGTVAENVLKYGTGGINIDGCRIGDGCDKSEHFGAIDKSECNLYEGGIKQRVPVDNSKGRFPANIILDSEAGAMLDKQSGESVSCVAEVSNKGSIWGSDNSDIDIRGHNDTGGASRFFYCAKASKADRDEGLEGIEGRKKGAGCYGDGLGNAPKINGEKHSAIKNFHPTVKPTDLMQYLVRLVTPPGGIVIDPFMGSGSTGKGAIRENFKFIGIERESDYIPIAIARINAPAQVILF